MVNSYGSDGEGVVTCTKKRGKRVKEEVRDLHEIEGKEVKEGGSRPARKEEGRSGEGWIGNRER